MKYGWLKSSGKKRIRMFDNLMRDNDGWGNKETGRVRGHCTCSKAEYTEKSKDKNWGNLEHKYPNYHKIYSKLKKVHPESLRSSNTCRNVSHRMTDTVQQLYLRPFG